jgi:hypothetical protein
MSPKEKLYRPSLTYVRSDALTVVNMKTTVFWDVTSYSLVTLAANFWLVAWLIFRS